MFIRRPVGKDLANRIPNQKITTIKSRFSIIMHIAVHSRLNAPMIFVMGGQLKKANVYFGSRFLNHNYYTNSEKKRKAKLKIGALEVA